MYFLSTSSSILSPPSFPLLSLLPFHHSLSSLPFSPSLPPLLSVLINPENNSTGRSDRSTETGARFPPWADQYYHKCSHIFCHPRRRRQVSEWRLGSWFHQSQCSQCGGERFTWVSSETAHQDAALAEGSVDVCEVVIVPCTMYIVNLMTDCVCVCVCVCVLCVCAHART